MRTGLMILSFWGLATIAAAKTVELEGVPFNCLGQMQYGLIKSFIKENAGDQEAIKEYKDYIRSMPAYFCRERQDRSSESATWCDGSGCSGISAQLIHGKCVLGEAWTGQDDQDIIDPEEYAQDCLTKEDF
jgi:hypothetical protein